MDGLGFVGMYMRGAPGGRKLEAQFEVFRRKLRHDVCDQVGLIAYEDAGTLLVELGADDVAAWVQRRTCAWTCVASENGQGPRLIWDGQARSGSFPGGSQSSDTRASGDPSRSPRSGRGRRGGPPV